MIPQVAVELMKSGMIMMYNISWVDVLNSVPSFEVMESLSILHSFNHRWARCKKQGKSYGDTLITQFMEDICEVFERGERDKGAKMTSGIIEVGLQRIYPDYYALP